MPDTESAQVNQAMETLQHVSIKTPEFMETAVLGWFQILESQFILKGITVEATKFHHLIAALPASIVSKIAPDLFSKQNYTELKNAVISINEKTKPEFFEKLMSTTEMAGRPSVISPGNATTSC